MSETAANVQHNLEGYGYKVIEHEKFKPGQRVRHVGEQYTVAYNKGTGSVVAVMERGTPFRGHQRDIEIIVAHDDGIVRQWADYHTRVAALPTVVDWL